MTDRIVMPRERIIAWLTPAERARFGVAELCEPPVLVPGIRTRIDLPWAGCSTCRREMTEERTPEAVRTGTWRTRGHLRPRQSIGLPGNAADLHHRSNKPTCGRRLWAWQCYRCNHQQGRFTLRQWQVWLQERSPDGRAAIVGDMIAHLRSLGVPENDF